MFAIEKSSLCALCPYMQHCCEIPVVYNDSYLLFHLILYLVSDNYLNSLA